MELEHYIHMHKLSFMDKENERMCCFGCLQIIYGPTYICKTGGDKFAMHKSCAELPPQIQREAFHPHPLAYNIFNPIACDGCGELWSGIISYRCMNCTFNLDFRCAVAFSNDNELATTEGRGIKTTIQHFSHNHKLTRCKFPLPMTELGIEIFKSLWNERIPTCMACEQNLHGTLIYTCLPCQFALHESCVNDMPRQVLQSPFHPQHILRPQPIHNNSSHRCSACRKEVYGIIFYCNECDVKLHVSCAKYQTRAIQHNCHPHPLLQLGRSITTEISCHVCHKYSGDFFSCIKCDFSIHVECISLPPSVKHARHLHSLVLKNPFVEDDSGDYYCDMCETERNPEHHVYYCEECNYIGHIGCANLEVEPPEEMFLDQGLEKKIADKIMDDRWLELDGILVHSEMIIQKDALHPHPLTLNDDLEAIFVCNGCGELCSGLSYNCNPCLFSLDTECVALNDYLAKHEAKKWGIKTTITHFSHNHQLNRCKINISKMVFDVSCNACKQDPYGLMYICLHCKFNLHESCLNNMPMQVQSPFHPKHLLFLFPLPEDNEGLTCDICDDNVEGLTFGCLPCKIQMHCSCANYQTREFKHNCHVDHHLLHLGKSIFVKRSPECGACGIDCSNTLFCCIECKFYIHLECIPLPYIIKHKRHLHPLTLTNSVVEDNSGKYSCDICETERNPELDVYYCKECSYVAHIDCVISEVEPPEAIFQYMVPRPRKEKAEKYGRLRDFQEYES